MRIQFVISYLCLGFALGGVLSFGLSAMDSSFAGQKGKASLQEAKDKVEKSRSQLVQTLKDVESRVKELEDLFKDRQDADRFLKINQAYTNLRLAIFSLVGKEGDLRKAILIFQELYSKNFFASSQTLSSQDSTTLQKTSLKTINADDPKELIQRFHGLLNAVEATLSLSPESQNVGKNDPALQRKKQIQELRDILNGLIEPKKEAAKTEEPQKEVSQAADPHEILFSSQFQKLLQGDLEKRIQKARKYLLNLLITELGSEKDNNLFTSYRQLFDNQALQKDFSLKAIQKLKTDFEKYFQTFFPQDQVTFFPIKHANDNNIRFIFVVYSFQKNTPLFYGIEISLLKEKFSQSNSQTPKVLYRDQDFNTAKVQMPGGYSWSIDFAWINIYNYQKGFLMFKMLNDNISNNNDANKKTLGIQSVKEFLKSSVQTNPGVNSSNNAQPPIGKISSTSTIKKK